MSPGSGRSPSRDPQRLTQAEAHSLLVAFAEAITSGEPLDWQHRADWLRTCDGRTWLALDDAARRWSYRGDAPVSGRRGWLGENRADPSGFVAAITSLHVEGRIRQRATQILSGRPGALQAAALAVRSLDHVPEVREDALLGLRVQVSIGSVEPALSVLLAGRGRSFAAAALSAVIEAATVVRPLPRIADALQASRDRSVRRWAFQQSHDTGGLAAEVLVELVRTERDQLLRRHFADWLAQSARPPQLRMLLESKFVDGRLLALTKLEDDDLPLSDLLPLLADRSSLVRQTAQWRAGRRNVEVADWYRDQLGTDALPAGRTAACLQGLRAIGSDVDIPQFVRRLDDPSPTVRSAALQGIAALATAESVRELALPHLLDPSPRVATTAARILSRAGAGIAEVEVAWASDQVWSRRAAWRLEGAPGGWAQVVAGLRAASDRDESLSRLGRSDLRNWLNTSAANTYRQPSAEQRRQIVTTLDSSGLTAAEQRLIGFHAGVT